MEVLGFLPTEGDPNSIFLATSLGVPGSLILIVALVLVTAFFAMAEMALISVRRTRIKQLVEEGSLRALNVQKLQDDPARFLATVQIGVTLVGFFASATGAVTLAKPLSVILSHINIGIISENALGVSVFLVTLMVAYFTLVIGEISPKSLGLQNSERVALFAAGPLLFLSLAASPLVKLITWSSNIVVRPFGGTASFSPPMLTEEELKMLVQAGEEEGVLEEEEKEMIHSIFEFTDTIVRKVMVPRIDIKAVDVDDSIDELLDVIIKAGHSRIPIYEENIDNIVGIVHAKDLLRGLHEHGQDIEIKSLMRSPYVIPENKMVDELLAEFKRSKIQMAIVVDEYGGTAGLVTIEDLLEEIVGDIMDEYDVEGPAVEVVDENTTIVDARTAVDEINEQMGLSLPEEEFDTIGGFVFGLLGREAHQGEKIEYEAIDLFVEKTDGRRIQRIKIVKTDRTPAEYGGEGE